VLLLRKPAAHSSPIDFPALAFQLVFGALIVLGAGTLIGAWAATAKPITPVTSSDTLKVLTYNIQQGYDAQGQKNYDGQLALIRQLNPDVIGLQESDTSRIANGNSDVVRYFADQLGMYSYYGPTTVLGTFGIALLSRYPIENPRTFFMTSEGEQTASIVAEITAGGKAHRIMVTHLGNGGPLPQLEDILSTLTDQQNIILMGDFNFNPASGQYRQATSVLDDAWIRAGSPAPAGTEWDAERRIDHVFVSSGVEVADAQYVLAPLSDHPALVVEVR
jgi:endonuclease/exonuclease/phosphatase family metal-dependent hydrolase